MNDAQSKFNQVLESTPIKNPEIPVVGNVSASLMHTVDDIKADLGKQLISPVRWTDSMQTLISIGVGRCYEIGSGKVLSGLMRRINRSIPTSPLDSPSSLTSVSDSSSEEG